MARMAYISYHITASPTHSWLYTLYFTSCQMCVHMCKPLRAVPTNTLSISIIWWLIGLNYASILPVTHLDLMMHLMALNNLCIYCVSRTFSLSVACLKARGQLLPLNCLPSNHRNNNCDGKERSHSVSSEPTGNCCYVYILPMSSSAGVALRSELQLPHQTAERRTLDRKKIFTPPICHPSCSTHLTWDEEGKG